MGGEKARRSSSPVCRACCTRRTTCLPGRSTRACCPGRPHYACTRTSSYSPQAPSTTPPTTPPKPVPRASPGRCCGGRGRARRRRPLLPTRSCRPRSCRTPRHRACPLCTLFRRGSLPCRPSTRSPDKLEVCTSSNPHLRYCCPPYRGIPGRQPKGGGLSMKKNFDEGKSNGQLTGASSTKSVSHPASCVFVQSP